MWHDNVYRLIIFSSNSLLVFQVYFKNIDGTENLDPKPPFLISLPRDLQGEAHALPGNEKSVSVSGDAVNAENGNLERAKLFVQTYVPPDPGPYPQDQPKQNSVRFTPTQVL